MAKQNLLLVDADLRSLRVLEVSLRKAGYSVASTGNASDALAMLELSRPDLVLCDTRLPTMDGFELIQEIRRRPELADIPLMILSSDVSVETKVRGLELGVEDYLTKPIYIKELLARVNITLQRKRREGMEHLDHGNKRRFSGSLSDMGVVDLLQAIDHNKKSGVLYLTSGNFDGAIYFCNGAPVDAAVGRLQSSRAIYRTLLWTDGTFEVDFREIDREDHVQTSMQAVLMEGLRRVDEWGRLLEQLPDLDTVFDVSDTQLIARLAEIPDEINSVLREFDGERSLWQIVDACDDDDIDTLNAVSKLYFEGLLYNTGRQASTSAANARGAEGMPELGDMVLPHISSGPPLVTHTLAPAWPSAPIGSDPAQGYALDDDTLQLNIPANPRIPEGMGRATGHMPKRRKARKRKKRNGRSVLPAAERKPSAAPVRAEAEQVREVDESCAEITPSTIAPPPEDAAIAEILQAEASQAALPIPALSKPPHLPGSMPASAVSSALENAVSASTQPPMLLGTRSRAPQQASTASDEHPTVEFTPLLRGAATPPPLRNLTRPPLDAATNDVDAESTLRSTAPPPASATPEAMFAQSDSPQAPLSVSALPQGSSSLSPSAEANTSRRPGTPPPLPFVSKPPPDAELAPRGFTIPPLVTASADGTSPASADAETKPPPPSAAASPTLTDALIAAASQPPISDEAHQLLAASSDFPEDAEIAAISPSAAPSAHAAAALPETSPLQAAGIPTRSPASPPPLPTTRYPATRDSGLPGSDDDTSSQLAAAAMPPRDHTAPPELTSANLSIEQESAAEHASVAPRLEAELSAPLAAASRSPDGITPTSRVAAASSAPADIVDRAAAHSSATPPSEAEMTSTPSAASMQLRNLTSPPQTAFNGEASSQPPTAASPAQIAGASKPLSDTEDAERSPLAAASQAPSGVISSPAAAFASDTESSEGLASAISADEEAGSQLAAAAQVPRGFASASPAAVASARQTDIDSSEDLPSAIPADEDAGSQLPATSQAPRGSASSPQIAAASARPAELEGAQTFGSATSADGDADSPLSTASLAPLGFTAPSQAAAASAPPAGLEGAAESGSATAIDDDADSPLSAASLAARGFSSPPQAAATSNLPSSRAPRGFTSPPQFAGASVAPAEIADSEPLSSAISSEDDADSPLTAASLAPSGLTSPPELAAAAAPPSELEGQLADGSARPTDMDMDSSEDLASATSFDADASSQRPAASRSPRGFTTPPQFASVAPAEIADSEPLSSAISSEDDADSPLAALSLAPRDSSSPPQFTAASRVPADMDDSQELGATTSYEAEAGSQPPAASQAPQRFSSPPQLADASAPPADIDGLEELGSAAYSGDESGSQEATSSQAPQRFSSPPQFAAASAPPADIDGLEEFGSAAYSGDESGAQEATSSQAPQRFSSPPQFAATSAPPADPDGSAASLPPRDFASPPLAAISNAPSELAGSGIFRSVIPPAEEGAPAVAPRASAAPPRLDSMSDPPSESELERLAALTSSISDESSSQLTADSMPVRDFTAPALASASDLPPDSGRLAGSDLPASTAQTSLRPGFSSPPPLAAASNPRFSAPPLATVTNPPPDSERTEAATSAAPQQSSKRLRPPLFRTATPPAFDAGMTPPLGAAGDASASTGADQGGATNSAAPQTTGASHAPSAPAGPVREALAKVISFVPRKRASDAAARASSRAPATERAKSGSPGSTNPGGLAAPSARSLPARPSRDAWSSTSGAPGQTAAPNTSGAPSQAAPQAKRHISRWVQAGGVAATLALAAGLLALRARDTAPQGSLITAVPEMVEPQEIRPPTAASDPEARAANAELDALQKPAAAPTQAANSNLPKPQAQIEAAKPRASPNAAVAAPTQAAKPQPSPPEKTPAAAAPAQVARSAPSNESAQQSPPAAATPQPAAAPPESSASAQASTDQALTKGRSLEQKGKIQDALALYNKAIEAGGASSQLLSRIAFVYLNQRKNTLAEAHAKRAVDADETNSEAWIVLGAAQDQLGKKQAAQEAYRNCASKGQGQYVTECKRMLR